MIVTICISLVLLLISGCQDSKPSDDKEPVSLKILHPAVRDVIESSKPNDSYFSYNSSAGIYYRAIPGFVWRGVLADVENSYADPSGYSYAGFSMQVETNESKPELEQICSSSVAIALYPPTTTATGTGAVFDRNAGLSNSAVTSGNGQCGNDYFQLRARDDDGDGQWDRFQYSFPPGIDNETLLTDAAPGDWQLRNGSDVLANFEIPPLAPVKHSAPGVVVPAPQINFDPVTGLVDSVEISWWRYSSATELYESVDSNEEIYISAVMLLDSSSGIDAETAEEYKAYGLAKRAIFSQYPWIIADAAGAAFNVQITTLQISYNIDGVSYRFIWQDL